MAFPRPPDAGTFTAGGDLSGTDISQTVIGLRGRPFSSSAPTSGQVPEWSGAAWVPTTPSGGSGLVLLTLTYNGSDPFDVQAITPIGYDPDVGGVISFIGPSLPFFGADAGNVNVAAAAVDASGVIQTVLFIDPQLGITFYGAAADADPVQIAGDPILLEAGSGQIQFDADAGIRVQVVNRPVGFFGAPAVDQQVSPTPPSGGVVIDAEARTAIDAIITLLSQAAGGLGLTS